VAEIRPAPYTARVNFLAHAVFAERRSSSPAYVLGSMLPDFATMAGLRIASIEHGELREGVDFHHAGDDAFHGAPIFLEMMSDARDQLEELGVSLGPAMAVSHVGIELLLDGWLVENHGAASYRDAMRGAEPLADAVTWTRSEGRQRWRRLRSRLVEAPVPEAYTDCDFVADRLERILSHRPRLALDEGEAEQVHVWAQGARVEVWKRAESLLAQVESRLGEAPEAIGDTPPVSRRSGE
jgi:acyl carrier protein phosphodiesterase